MKLRLEYTCFLQRFLCRLISILNRAHWNVETLFVAKTPQLKSLFWDLFQSCVHAPETQLLDIRYFERYSGDAEDLKFIVCSEYYYDFSCVRAV